MLLSDNDDDDDDYDDVLSGFVYISAWRGNCNSYLRCLSNLIHGCKAISRSLVSHPVHASSQSFLRMTELKVNVNGRSGMMLLSDLMHVIDMSGLNDVSM